jgi:hypothetical protein
VATICDYPRSLASATAPVDKQWKLEMITLKISYDLVDVKNYDLLYEALEAIGAKRLMFSEWVVNWTLPPMQLVQYLQSFLDHDDVLVVSEIRSDNFWFARNAEPEGVAELPRLQANALARYVSAQLDQLG